MISQQLLTKASDFAKSQSEKFGSPSLFHLELTNAKGQWLAEQLNADKNIVMLGTNLMDCMVGEAIAQGIVSEHVAMGAKKAQELLQNSELTDEEKENVMQCVLQHHGNTTFFSIESEICCNADCYKFISVQGVLGGMKSSRPMELNDMVELYKAKAQEKFNALTLQICIDELTPQYESIKTLLENYKE